MINDQKGWCENTEQNNSTKTINEENKGCCEDINVKINKEDNVVECRCGCGAEHPDESEVDNPIKPKYIADEKFIKEFEAYAHSLGINEVGYTQLTPDLLIQDTFIQFSNSIVLTMEMSKELLATLPGDKTQELNDAHYAKLGTLSYKLSDFLRENGYATEVAHPYDALVNFSLLAQKSGIGFIGKSGLLITPKTGPGQKISAIFVSIANLPLKRENEYVWIPDYCKICGKCIRACPENALTEIESCCGGKDVLFNQDLCIGCSQGCTYCIEACPFTEDRYESVKNKFDTINAKLKKKHEQKFEEAVEDDRKNRCKCSIFTTR